MLKILNKIRVGLLLVLIWPPYLWILLWTVVLSPKEVLDELSRMSKTGYKV